MNDLNQLFEALNEISVKNSVVAYIPSLKREVKFKPITVAQQKALLDCGYDNVIFHTKFIIAVYNIIKENCLEPDITKELTVVDRVSIILSYRQSLFGNYISSEYGKVDITPVFDRVKNLNLSNSTIEIDNVKIDLCIPNIEEQYIWEKETRSNFSEQTAVAEKIVQALGDLMIGELCKSIKEVYINNQPVNYVSLSPTQKIEIVSKLPNNISKEIIQHVKKITDSLLELLTITTVNGDKLYTTTVDISLNTLTIE